MGRWSSFERWEMEKLQLQGEGDKEMANMATNLIFGLREMGRWRSFERWGDGELQLWDEEYKDTGCNFLIIKFFILFF